LKIVNDFEVFSISTLGDVVRIPPALFGTSLKKAAINILKSKYESMVNSNLGYIIMILDAKVDPMGKVIAGNGGTFHRVTFDALTFYPKLQEIVMVKLLILLNLVLLFELALLMHYYTYHKLWMIISKVM